MKWSDYQGSMNWHNAKAKCASSKMRLPTRAEFDFEYKEKGTESWKKDGNWYWTLEEYSEASAHYYDAETGYPDSDIHVEQVSDIFYYPSVLFLIKLLGYVLI